MGLGVLTEAMERSWRDGRQMKNQHRPASTSTSLDHPIELTGGEAVEFLDIPRMDPATAEPPSERLAQTNRVNTTSPSES